MAKTKTRTKTKPKGIEIKPAGKSATRKTGPVPVVTAPAGPVLRKLRSVIYQVTDLPRAKTFYAALLGREPYFDKPFYVGFDVDGQELGLHPDTSRIPPGPGGAIAYWRVDDLYTSWEHVLAHGAEPVEPPHNVGENTDVAIVADPFGNYIGLIQTA